MVRFDPWHGIGWVIVLFIILGSGFYFYQQGSGNDLISAQLIAPSTLRDTLAVQFVKEGGRGNQTAAAPIDQIGKYVHAGVQLSPAMEGQWQWIGHGELLFTPAADWPAGQPYQVVFKNTIFDKGVKLKDPRHEFSTASLSFEVNDLRLYQDLMKPEVQKIVGTLDFNFPVDVNSLTERVHLAMQEIKNDHLHLSAERIPVKISFNNTDKRAFIESETLKLPPVPSFVNLVIDKGVLAAKGPSKTKDRVIKKLLIPDVDSFLQIAGVDARIQRDSQDNPEQILHIETTIGVDVDDLLKRLHVYVLPNDYPETPFQGLRKDYQWSSPGEVTPEVLKLAALVPLQPLPEEHPLPTVHQFKLQVHTPSYLLIQVDKGLTGAGSFFLAKDYKAIVRSPDYAREIHFVHNGSLMAKSGGKTMTVAVRGIPEVKFSICQVLPQHLNHLVTQTYGDFQSPRFNYGTIGCEDICQIFSEFRQFHVAHPCELKYTSIDLAQYLESHLLGLFLVKAQEWDTKTNTPASIEDERLVLITDMALIVKDHADGTHDLFVQSITDGLPVADAEVLLLGKNSLPISKAATDADGRAHFPNVQDFKDDREPSVYLVQKGGDASFIPYHRRDRVLNDSRFDISGTVDQQENGLSAFVFLDRGIYRPGDLVHIGGVVKNRYASDPIPGVPLEIVVIDPLGAVLLAQKMPLPESHLFTLDYLLPVQAPTGNYQVKLYAVKDRLHGHLLGSASFRAGEFLPDRLKMNAHFMPDAGTGWLTAEGQKAAVDLWNLYGTPAANHAVKAKMVLTPKRLLHFPNYERYCFANPSDELDSTFSFTENFDHALTDGNGHLEFDLHLERFSRATYQIDFFAEGFEAGGGRAVSTELSALVVPSTFLVGYKPDEDLSFIKQHSKASVHFIAISPELQPVAASSLQAEVVERKMASTLVKKPDGTYKYQYTSQRTTESTQTFEISRDGDTFILPTGRVGDFALVIKDAGGAPLAEVFFSVTGEFLNSNLNSRELAVKLDKKEYLAGAVIEMQITAPYAGAGLITIERDKVYAYRWFKTDSSASVQTIAIPPDFQGSGYINVAFVRAWDSDEIYMNPLSHAIVPFNVTNEPQTLHVDVDAPALARAGTDLKIQFKTDHPARIVLYAVDEGLLRLDGYQTPNPLAYFFRKSALGVKTSQTADLILPKPSGKPELSATGGDRQAQLLVHNFNPFKLKTEKATVFWFGALDSGPEPRTVACPIPDAFNGSLRIMAVAAAPGQVGSTQRNTVVQSDFIIQPNVPRFIAPGDHMTVTVSIARGAANEGCSPATVTLSVSPQLVILGSSEEELTIPLKGEEQASFQIRAAESLGEAELTFMVKQGDQVSKVTSTISVRPPSVYQTYLISGCDDSSLKAIRPDRQLYPEYRILEAAASTNPLILAHGLHGVLDNYPYDCTEQLISRSFAGLIMAGDPFFECPPQLFQEKFKECLQMLRERQTACGGFSVWPGRNGAAAAPLPSILAMDFLTEAKLKGYAVPEDMFRGGIHYLEELARGDVDSLSEARMQAYAIYVLTRNGLVTTNYLTNLQLYLTADQKDIWRKDLASAFIASAYKLLQSSLQADHLIAEYRLQTALQDKHSLDVPLIEDAQYITLLARHFPERLKDMHGQAMMALVKGISKDRISTRGAACCFQALSAFSKTGSDESLSISELHEDNQEQALISLNPSFLKVNFDAQIKEIRFHNPMKETYFYQISQAGFDQCLSKQPVKNGLEIFREYRDIHDQPIQSTQLGSKIKACILARSLKHPVIGHTAIVDLLPGGFEVVQGSVQAAGCDYVDVREDRIIFYGLVGSSPTEISYHLQAVNRGEYAVPPIFAEAMDQPWMQAQGAASRITIH